MRPTESAFSKTIQGTAAKAALSLLICILVVLAFTALRFALHIEDRHLLSAALNLFLIAVLVGAIRWGTRYAILISLISALAFGFFLPPAGHFHSNDPRLWTLLTACLITGIVAGQLSSRVRREAVRANQQRAEAVAAQQRFEDLVNSVEGIVWEADAKTFKFSFVSKQAERILGYPVEQWLRTPGFWKDHLHPKDRDWAIQASLEATAEICNHDFEYRMIGADGRSIWVHDLATVVVEDGRATQLRGVIVDVSQRKQAEEAAQQSQKEIRDIIETVPAVAWSAGADGANSFVNKRWTEYTGQSVDEAAGSGWQATVHPEDLSRNLEVWNACVASGEPYKVEVRLRRSDGQYRWHYLHGLPLRDERGAILKWYGLCTDIEDRKRAEEERERLRQLESDLAHINRVSTLGELTASLAHEVNQPIAAAVTNASTCVRWLAGENPNIEEARETAKRIVKDANRAAEIITRLRQLFQKSAPQRELVDLNEVINEMVVLLRNEAAKQRITIRTELAADLPAVQGDRIQLQQVLMNLMINGMEAMKAVDGVRELRLSSQLDSPDNLLISVADMGVGLPQNKDKIFDAFYTTKPQGTGMGLAISRSIVESHGGRLWVGPDVERGAVFHFTVPITNEAEA